MAAGLIQAAPDLTLAMTFLITWIRPYTFGPTAVKHLILVVLVEFVVIHSSGFMGAAALAATSVPRRLLVILGFGFFYSLFTGVVSMAFHSSWPFLSFWGLTGNRMLNVVVSPAPNLRNTKIVMGGWALTVAAYLVLVFLTAFLPVPRLGITADVVARQELTGGGLWIDHPETAIALGFFYFLAVGVGELALTGRAGGRDRDGPLAA